MTIPLSSSPVLPSSSSVGAAGGAFAGCVFLGRVTEIGFIALPDRLDAIIIDDGLEASQIAFCKERQGDAFSAHPCRSARAVRVAVAAGGKVVIDDVAGMGEIESPAGQVRRHHYLDLHPAKPVE